MKAVRTADGCPRDENGNRLTIGAYIRDHPILAHEKVRFVGEAIAVVAARDEDSAEEAAEQIDVDYEELPAVFDPIEAMTPDVPRVYPLLAEDEDPTGPFGAKGIGEPALVATAAAVANAICDAIGVRIHDMPFSPDRILAALEKNEDA